MIETSLLLSSHAHQVIMSVTVDLDFSTDLNSPGTIPLLNKDPCAKIIFMRVFCARNDTDSSLAKSH